MPSDYFSKAFAAEIDAAYRDLIAAEKRYWSGNYVTVPIKHNPRADGYLRLSPCCNKRFTYNTIWDDFHCRGCHRRYSGQWMKDVAPDLVKSGVIPKANVR